MNKITVLKRLEVLKSKAEDSDARDIVKLEVIDLLLDYINDPHIRKALEEIPL